MPKDPTPRRRARLETVLRHRQPDLTLVLAIQRIGSTMASVLGVMEPPTAVCVGILVFDEPSSASLWIGMCLICLSVLVVMLGPRIGSRRAKKQ